MKKVLFSLFSLFLIYRSFDLMKMLDKMDKEDLTMLQAFLIAFILNLFITGVFAFPGFVFASHRVLPDSYYQIKNPILLKKSYQYLGVEYFKYFLLLFFWGHEKNRKKYFNGTKGGIKTFIYETKQSEFGHFSAFIVIFVCASFLIINGFILVSIFTLLINFIGNFYPVILQRHHRLRLRKLNL